MARLAINACMSTCLLGVCVCVCVCACMHAHITSIKCFLTLKCIHVLSNITTEMKTLELSTNIDHSFMFNSKDSSIVDDYLFNKEITKSGLKRKREPENIVGTKKSKKRLRRL